MPELEPLWPGSWINANFDTWIGESEENTAWDVLGKTRDNLAKWGIPQPDPNLSAPTEKTALAKYNAWEAMYAAEGSDWFWWYGGDQGAPGGDTPFDEAFRIHLTNVYRYAKEAGINIEIPDIPPVLAGGSTVGGGAMALSTAPKIPVTFIVDAKGQNVAKAIYIVGAPDELGAWTPNKIAMFDDATHDDEKAKDGIWSVTFEFPEGAKVDYKYTNSGSEGKWVPGEEFPVTNRAITVKSDGGKMIVRDIFGKM
jgi:hypothetical protein